MTNDTPKAAALISGGLDSMLAAKLLIDQGIHVEGITFFTGFCTDGLHHVSGVYRGGKIKRNNAEWTTQQLGIPHHIINIVEEYKSIVINPSHGYGAHLNPCLDCKIFMVKKAYEWIKENNFDFIITGEVIGQRPKSQRRDTMPVISRESGADDLLLRPLCAQLLPATKPELEGWVDRNKLLGISGRSRKNQIDLAKGYGIEEYSQPAGGCCVLTDESYSKKLSDLWSHRGKKDYEFDDVMLLSMGRHLRPRDHFKVIVSREEPETLFMEGYRNQFGHIKTVSHAGPISLIEGDKLSAEDWLLAARITARFSQGRDADEVQVSIVPKGEEARTLNVAPLPPSEVLQNWYI
jgi:predicted subunit of tRNA(5-methylaminomethyl-2-thiouridylate) methyltransferase